MKLLCLLLLFLQFIQSFSDDQEIKEEHPTFYRGSTQRYKYKSYLTFKEMEDRLFALSHANPDNLQLEIGGHSREGRNIYLVTISDGVRRSEGDGGLAPGLEQDPSVNGGDAQRERKEYSSNPRPRPVYHKPVIFVDAGIHAREWVAPAAAFYLIDQLLKTPKLTRGLEWRIMPVVNPDGYVYTHTDNRKWRKNRAYTYKSQCRGVDLNRNFDAFWNETHNDKPCWDTFSGDGPFSEPESQAVRNAVQVIRNRIQAYITLHTYGQLFLYPYGYTKDSLPAKEVQKLKEMGDGMAKVIFNRYGNEYKVLQASAIGAAAGGSDDWAYMKMKAPYSYTFELQGRVGGNLFFSFSGFELPKWQLPQAVDECWLALQYLGERIMEQLGVDTRIQSLQEQQQQQQQQQEEQNIQHKQKELQDDESGEHDDDRKRIYSFGFSQLENEVINIQNEVRARSSSDPSQGCVRKGNMLICPHMVFWGSMLKNFKRI